MYVLLLVEVEWKFSVVNVARKLGRHYSRGTSCFCSGAWGSCCVGNGLPAAWNLKYLTLVPSRGGKVTRLPLVSLMPKPHEERVTRWWSLRSCRAPSAFIAVPTSQWQVELHCRHSLTRCRESLLSTYMVFCSHTGHFMRDCDMQIWNGAVKRY